MQETAWQRIRENKAVCRYEVSWTGSMDGAIKTLVPKDMNLETI